MKRTNVYKRILVPIDGSSAANLGLREALRLARQHGATLCLFHAVEEPFVTSAGVAVMSPDELLKAFRDAGREILAKAEALARRRGVRARAVLSEREAGPVADSIVREAKRCKADLIVMGTHGRRGSILTRTSPTPTMAQASSSRPTTLARKVQRQTG